jgi:hypothetical protein
MSARSKTMSATINTSGPIHTVVVPAFRAVLALPVCLSVTRREWVEVGTVVTVLTGWDTDGYCTVRADDGREFWVCGPELPLENWIAR